MLVYGAAKLFSCPAFAADSLNNVGGAVDPATLQKPAEVKFIDVQCEALAASCGTICTIAAVSIFWIGFACAVCLIAGMGKANSK